jgi:N-acetylglutamate synthase-like GNAT family acetyltransferase
MCHQKMYNVNMNYIIKQANEIDSKFIPQILKAWGISEWIDMSNEQFVEKFSDSEFHIVLDNNEIVSVLRIYKNFSFNVNEKVYNIPEMVGLVSIVEGRGYGKFLLENMKKNLVERNVECIGFCFEHNRGFYSKCGIEVMEGKAKFFLEEQEDRLVPSEDDDVININLKPETREAIINLTKDNPAILKNPQISATTCAI